MDKLKNMDKEQKQWLMVGGMIFVGVVYGIWDFGFTPLQLEQQDAANKILNLEKQIASDRRVKSNVPGVEKKVDIAKDFYVKHRSSFVPLKNPIIWAPTFLKKLCEPAGIESAEREIECIGIGKKGIYINDYAMKVTLSTTYHRVGRFMAELENQCPLATVSGFKIAVGTTDTQTVRCELVITLPQENPAKQTFLEGVFGL